MVVDDTIKKLFIKFLSEQGITVEFSLAIKPLYDSTTHYLDDCEVLKIFPANIIMRAFNWKTSAAGYAIWDYHNIIWNHCLQLEGVCFGKMGKIDKNKQVKNAL